MNIYVSGDGGIDLSQSCGTGGTAGGPVRLLPEGWVRTGQTGERITADLSGTAVDQALVCAREQPLFECVSYDD